ncbi:hypothetical protein [Sphingomonas sp. RS2018]
MEAFATADFVAFGLVLHSANINEVNRVAQNDEVWKTVHNGVSIIFLVVYALLLFTTIIPASQINVFNAIRAAIVLSFVSLIISASIFFRSNSVSELVP